MKFGTATSKGFARHDEARQSTAFGARTVPVCSTPAGSASLALAEVIAIPVLLRVGTARAPKRADSGSVRRRVCRSSAFTLAEVLAALMFMAIVIPVAVEALHIASVSGEVAVRKAEAARIADKVLTESVVTTNWNQSTTGTTMQNGHEFHWTLSNATWPADPAMQLLTAEVAFTAQGRDYSVHLSTLANAPSTGAITGLP